MKTLLSGIQAHLQGELITVASCLYLQPRRRAGVASSTADVAARRLANRKMTDHDIAVHVNLPASITGDAKFTGINGRYEPHTFDRSAIKLTADLNINSVEIRGVLAENVMDEIPQIFANDIRSGVFDKARATLFLVNYEDTTQGMVLLIRGFTSGATIHRDGTYTMQVEGLTSALRHRLVGSTQADCRHDLGDAGCGVPITTSAWTRTGTVTSVVNASTYPYNMFGVSMTPSAATPNDWFSLGVLTWTSGANEGLSFEVNRGNATQITLALPTPAAISVGDEFSVYPGCDKRFLGACRDKFDNQDRFEGEPLLPGRTKVNQYGIGEDDEHQIEVE